MKSLIIPVFIMNRGCPNRCVFCNESILAGNYSPRVTEEEFKNTVERYLSSGSRRFERRQIAFYGGNFTGLDRNDREELLDFTLPYLENGSVHSLRLSTRPDCVDRDELRYLHSRGVRTIEIGAQSMSDDVLKIAGRGHDSASIRSAVNLLKEEGFETGLHLMAGLPGESETSFLDGINKVVKLAPHTVRIHPTVVLRDTELENRYREGTYAPLSLDEAVTLCGRALVRLKKAGIAVIRLGLHLSEEMMKEGNVVAGPLHPSFGSLVEERIFRDRASELLERMPESTGKTRFFVPPGDLSRLRGLRNGNVTFLENRFPGVIITTGEDLRMRPNTMRLVTDRGTREISLC